jgi:opacity protein-like surface antigen
MKRLLFVVSASLVLIPASFARDVYVKPHVTQNGTYVEGHHRTSPNGTKLDNYSTQGNYNPHTGNVGRVDPYAIEPYQPKRRH